MQNELVDAIAITAELTGAEMSDGAARVMFQDLSEYPLPQVLVALKRCRRELKSRLTIADVISRLDDGRPGVEQAWAKIPRSEDDSVVWTKEMAAAYGAAAPLLSNGDAVAARMAFKEAYEKEMQLARDSKSKVEWLVSFGRDQSLRESAVTEAIEKKQISAERGFELLPHSDTVVMMLTDSNQALIDSSENGEKIKLLAQSLANKNNGGVQ